MKEKKFEPEVLVATGVQEEVEERVVAASRRTDPLAAAKPSNFTTPPALRVAPLKKVVFEG